eukprot:scaffold11460_cov297-Chaetoceros_neogracile.AAC.1
MKQRISTKKLQCFQTITVAVLLTAAHTTAGFMQPLPHRHSATSSLQDNTRINSPISAPNSMPSHSLSHSHSQSCSSTALNVWWFGGSDVEQDDESCELVAIRIEKTSANSRRIAGDIIIPKPVDDVWAILTDYDNLSVHVPNLVESKRVSPASASKRISNPNGKQGDGSYQCTLYQKGAQKIVGFEFGASVTMDMAEHITTMPDPIGGGIAGEGGKKISFKCVDSQFFSVFDGEWKVSPTTDPEDPSKPASLVEYVVDVRPRGPVP